MTGGRFFMVGWGGGQYPNEVDPELLKSVDCVKLVKVWRQPVKKSTTVIVMLLTYY